MGELQANKKLAPPYLSFKTFVNFLERLERVGIPNRIDRSVMDSFSGAAKAQLITTLKYLHLTHNDGVPTDKLHKLVEAKDTEKKHLLKEIIISSYPFLFKEDFDLSRATSKELQDRFDSAGASGETTRKSIAFFMVAAKNTGIALSPHVKKFKFTSSKSPAVKNKKAHVGKSNAVPEEKPLKDKIDVSSWQELLLAKFPSFDPAWPDEVKTKWFEGFNDLMAQFKK